MQAERQRQRDLKKVQEMFSPDEAVVVIQGDDIIVRLTGMHFAVGKSIIQPEDFSLLTKLQRAIRVYPNAAVKIEGHTDSTGNDASNEVLSLERAEAVLSYLQANMSDGLSDPVAMGFGESAPIATNETPDGRALNRRIDVRLANALTR
jgi:outer membrane protein OmpA-like peptidoglycan-associated protein